jgi:hypothetical protein
VVNHFDALTMGEGFVRNSRRHARGDGGDGCRRERPARRLSRVSLRCVGEHDQRMGRGPHAGGGTPSGGRREDTVLTGVAETSRHHETSMDGWRLCDGGAVIRMTEVTGE